MENRLRIKPYFLVFLSAILAISISGCSEDFFDQKAGDRITPDQHYLTSIDAVISSQGAIAPLQDIMPQLIMLDGLRSDMMNVTENAQMHLREINEQIFMSGNPFIDPSSLYKVIININEVLANIDKVALTDRNFDPYITRIYKGNMIAMRSWAYFTLAKLYGKVSYIEDNLTEIDTDLPVLEKRVLIDTLIAQLRPEIDSLLFAETQMIEFALDHYINPKALLGELYLEIDDYANAVTYLKYACESFLNQPSVFKVDQTYKDAAWSTIFLNAETNGVENLSVIPFSSVEDQFNPLANWLGVNYAYEVKPSQVLVDSFLSQIPAAGAPGDLYRGIGVSIG